MSITSIEILTRDAGYAANPEDTIEAGLLNGMIKAQFDILKAQISWDEVTDRFVKGHVLATGERVLVRWTELPFAANEDLDAWLHEFDAPKPVRKVNAGYQVDVVKQARRRAAAQAVIRAQRAAV